MRTLCFWALLAAAGAGGCAYPRTQPLARTPPNQDDFDLTTPGKQPVAVPQYYFPQVALGPRNTQDLFVVLAFSGGGTRAAALAYGVLDELRRIEIGCPAGTAACERTLLDEVDVISSTSGGSFTSAYYALYGDRIFDPTQSFHTRFLKYNVQRELFGRAVYHPQSWPRLLNRVEIAANLYSSNLFQGSTYQDLVSRPRPFIILNAADYVSQKRFQFTQDYFDLLCTDLSSFSLARAVAASSAFPGLLNSMTIETHNNPCPVPRPDPAWLENVAKSQFPDRLAYRQYQDYRTFTDPNRKYLHLLDGGLADNLGLRSIYEGLRDAPAALPINTLLNLRQISNLLVIIVNARTGDKSITPANRALGPLTPQVVLGATSGIPMGTVTYDSVDMLTEFLDATRQAQKDQPGLFRTNIYAVELTFDNIAEEPARRYFKTLPTDFALPPSIVDCLISQGRRLLVDSWSYGGADTPFVDYVRTTLNGRIPPLPDHAQVKGTTCAVVPGQP